MLYKKPEKILIVDDEHDIALVLQEYLVGNGYSCITANDGDTALEMLEREKDYAILLLDISMPSLDGITVLKRLQDSGCCDTAVIMMSGHGSEETVVECMKNGAEDYIAKPFALEDMQQRIERAIAHRLARIDKRRLQQEKEDLILMLSHDMKNPLTAVVGSIDIIREECLGPVNEEQRDYLQAAIDSCNEVVVMIDNLLDIKKFEAGKIQMSIQPCNAYEIISKIADQYTRQAKHDGIVLSVDIEQGGTEIAVDKGSFTRVLGNLLGNAIKFTPEGGAISIACQKIPGGELNTLPIPDYAPLPAGFKGTGCYLKITVSDTGNGIPVDELDRLFDRYSQFTRKTERERGGAGLGLAYCKLAVEKFNGIIWAASEDGEGSSFTILLPCCSNGSN